MILVVYGTTGEMIKLAPVLARLKARNADMMTWCTGQQAEEITAMAGEIGLPEPDLWLANGFRGRALSRPAHIPLWAFRVGARFIEFVPPMRRRLRERGPSVVIVHGDTITTVIGSLFGKALGVPVAHVEAGMRSGDWRNPFPEELNRRIAAHLADLHFAPGPGAVANLRHVRGTVIDTGMNTVCDAVDLVPHEAPPIPDLPERFGIVSLHRFEFLHDRATMTKTLEVLAEHAAKTPLFFIDHSVTAEKIVAYKLDHLFDGLSFVRIPKLRYFAFVRMLRASTFAVTDSGGLQQECFYLGHPCLVHRMVTETVEGLGDNAVLSLLDPNTLASFLDDPDRFQSPARAGARAPSDIVVDALVAAGLAPGESLPTC